jgi:tetratricopeptide (TPR) repeat protein
VYGKKQSCAFFDAARVVSPSDDDGVHPDDADVLNLLGYGYRKSGDVDQARGYYLQALAADPKHRGANEYIGELYLETGHLNKAEERLAVLDDDCWLGCEEYTDLKEAIAEYKVKKGIQ